MHGLGVGTGPVHVPGRTDSTGNRPNRTGSCTGPDRFHREPAEPDRFPPVLRTLLGREELSRIRDDDALKLETRKKEKIARAVWSEFRLGSRANKLHA
jgi:hypothetical protein